MCEATRLICRDEADAIGAIGEKPGAWAVAGDGAADPVYTTALYPTSAAAMMIAKFKWSPAPGASEPDHSGKDSGGFASAQRPATRLPAAGTRPWPRRHLRAAMVKKKLLKRVAAGKASAAEVDRVLGPDAQVELDDRLKQRLEPGQTALKPKELHALVEHVLLNRPCPPFIAIGQRALIRQVVLLANDTASPAEPFAQRHAALLESSVHSVPFRLPPAHAGRPAGLRGLLYTNDSVESSECLAEHRAEPADLLLTRAELEAEGYPLAGAGGAASFAEGPAEQRARLRAIDCEMVEVEGGASALARVSIVDEAGDVLLDELVRPSQAVTDYRTQFSGLTAERLADARLGLAEAQRAVQAVVCREDILVGHSMENDLRALGLHHDRCIDTSVLFPHPLEGGRKRRLRDLSHELLATRIQQPAGGGHDSVEDARACMKLVVARLRNASFGAKRRRCFGTLADRLLRADEGLRAVLVEAPAVPAEQQQTQLNLPTASPELGGRLAVVPAGSDSVGALVAQQLEAHAGAQSGGCAGRAFVWCAGSLSTAQERQLLLACPSHTLVIALDSGMAPDCARVSEQPRTLCRASIGAIARRR